MLFFTCQPPQEDKIGLSIYGRHLLLWYKYFYRTSDNRSIIQTSLSKMPMLTDPAQQSANRTTSRSELSRNWRSKIDAPPTTGNNAATRTPGQVSRPDYLQSHTFSSKSWDKERKSEGPTNRETLRGEDDPSTLQAIAEGRRLYVGNMPYIAKTKDVEMLFAGDDYHMWASN